MQVSRKNNLLLFPLRTPQKKHEKNASYSAAIRFFKNMKRTKIKTRKKLMLFSCFLRLKINQAAFPQNRSRLSFLTRRDSRS